MPNFISKVSLPNDENLYDLKSYTTQGIFHAQVDSTSTSTAFTVTIPELTATEYYDGLTLLLYNGKVTSASGFTINVNGLGAKPSYSNMTLGNPVTPTDPTRDTTIFNINYAMLFIYNSTRVSGGCWICYRGYDANTNTIGYQVRTNNTTLKASAKFYRYRLLFTSADGTKWVPANTSTSTNATAKRDAIQTPIDPFGEIVWYGTTTAIEANANVTAAQLWQQYYGTYTAIGYSFNTTGAAATMTANQPIYLKCTPQADGSAIIYQSQPYVQTLPSTEDGYIYIFLGRAYNATNFELLMNHPVYYYKNGAIRLWTNAAATGSGLPAVTSADNDKVMKVVNGDWAITNEDEIFKISVLAILVNDSYSITANKTYAQIVTALNANKVCQVSLTFSDTGTPAYNTNYYLFNYSGSANGALNFTCFIPDSEHSAAFDSQTNISIPQILLTCTTNNNIDNWQIASRGLAAPGDTYIGSNTTPIYWNADHFNTVPWSLPITAVGSTTQPVYWDGSSVATTNLAAVASSGSYNDLSNKPTIPSAPGTLNTTATTAQSTSSSEALSGNITLHKISKTGNYADLQNAPTYNASTGNLSSTLFTGSGAGLTNIPLSSIQGADELLPTKTLHVYHDLDLDTYEFTDSLTVQEIKDILDDASDGTINLQISMNDVDTSKLLKYYQSGNMFVAKYLVFEDTPAIDMTTYQNHSLQSYFAIVWSAGSDTFQFMPVPGDDLSTLSQQLMQLLNAKEDLSNKVTSISSSSTDTAYPSAKAVYDYTHEANPSNFPYISSYDGPSNNGRFVTYLQNDNGDTYTHPYFIDPPSALSYIVPQDSIYASNGLGMTGIKLGMVAFRSKSTATGNAFCAFMLKTPIEIDTTTYAPTNSSIVSGTELTLRFRGVILYSDQKSDYLDTYCTIHYDANTDPKWSVRYKHISPVDYGVALSPSYYAGHLSILYGCVTESMFDNMMTNHHVASTLTILMVDSISSTINYSGGSNDWTNYFENKSAWTIQRYASPSNDTWANITSTFAPIYSGTDLTPIELKTNKVTSVSSSSTDDEYPSAKLLYTTQNTLSGLIQDVDEESEKTAHKVTSISSSSTDTQYPSAKCVYDNFSLNTHTHGNLTNDGKVGSTANQAVYTTTGGAITAGTLPTAITNAAISLLPTWSAVPTDSTYLLRRDTGGSAAYGQVPFSTVNSYIKTKNPVLDHLTYDSTEEAVKFIFT